jgi:hypothetical protein
VRRLNRWLWRLGTIVGAGYLAIWWYLELTRPRLFGDP